MKNIITIKEVVLQKDYRIRIPKRLCENVKPGIDFFDVKYDVKNERIIIEKSKAKRVNNYGKRK